MALPERYTWEAEFPGGRIETAGPGTDGDLAGCVRFSIIPAPGSGLRRHDIVGVRMVRRFGRGFIRALGGGCKQYLHCVVCDGFRMYVKSTDGGVLITPEDFELYV